LFCVLFDGGRLVMTGAPEPLGAEIVILKDCVAFGDVPLLAVTVPLYTPAVVGVPLNTPALLRVRPGGSAPALTVEGIGALPAAASVSLIPTPTVPLPAAALVMLGAAGAAVMVILKGCVAFGAWPFALVLCL